MKDHKIIEKLLKDHQSCHSEFQIDNFIVGNQGYDWSQYKQALREIDGRYQSLIGQKEELEIFDLKKYWRRSFGRRAEIRLARRKRIRLAMVDGIAETERELNRFVELALKLKQEIGDLGNGKREMLESNSWRQKALRMAGIDLIVNGRIGQPTMELVLALPKKDRDEVLMILSPQAKPDPMKLIGSKMEVTK